MPQDLHPADSIIESMLLANQVLFDELNSPAEHLIVAFLTARHTSGWWVEKARRRDLVGTVVTRFRHVDPRTLTELAVLYSDKARPGNDLARPLRSQAQLPSKRARRVLATQTSRAPGLMGEQDATDAFNIFATADNGTGALFTLLALDQERPGTPSEGALTLGDILNAYTAATASY